IDRTYRWVEPGACDGSGRDRVAQLTMEAFVGSEIFLVGLVGALLDGRMLADRQLPAAVAMDPYPRDPVRRPGRARPYVPRRHDRGVAEHPEVHGLQLADRRCAARFSLRLQESQPIRLAGW